MEEKNNDLNLSEEKQEFSCETNDNVVAENEVSLNDEAVNDAATEEENANEEETKGAK